MVNIGNEWKGNFKRLGSNGGVLTELEADWKGN